MTGCPAPLSIEPLGGAEYRVYVPGCGELITSDERDAHLLSQIPVLNHEFAVLGPPFNDDLAERLDAVANALSGSGRPYTAAKYAFRAAIVRKAPPQHRPQVRRGSGFRHRKARRPLD